MDKAVGVGNIVLSGSYVLVVRDKAGNRIYSDRGKNLVVDAGQNLMAELFDPGASPAKIDWGAVGSGQMTPDPSDTTLETEIDRVSSDSAVRSTNRITYTFTLVASGTLDLAEFGLFNAASAGTMFSRFLIQPFSAPNASVITVTWTLEFTGA